MKRNRKLLICATGFLLLFCAQVCYTQKLYWTDLFDRKIQRSNLDGSDVKVIMDCPFTCGLQGLGIDPKTNKLYWVNFHLNKIQRSNLDGSDIEDILTVQSPLGLAIDTINRKIYWTEVSVDKIQRSDLDGNNIEDVVLNVDASDIALDLVNNKLYWTPRASGIIRRSNLNGTNIENVFTPGGNDVESVAVDPFGGKVYWTNGEERKVQRGNLDKTGMETIYTSSGAFPPTGIELDLINQKVFWSTIGTTNDDKIFKANFNGSNHEVIISGLKQPLALVIDSRTCPSAPPIEPDPIPIPTLSQWALTIISLLLSIIGIIAIRQRNNETNSPASLQGYNMTFPKL